MLDYVGKSSQPSSVLIVVRWPVGGIRTFLKYTLANFSADDYRFSIVAPNSESLDILKDEVGPLVDHWYLIDSKGNETLELIKVTRQALREGEFDLIHAHGFTSGVVTFFSNIGFNFPTILTSHDVINREQFIGLRGLIKKHALNIILRKFRYVHSVSSDAESNLLEVFPNLKPRSLVIFNGVNSDLFFNAEKSAIKGFYNFSSDDIVVGFFGRFMNQKGFRVLVDAIEAINSNNSGATVKVVCFGSGAYIREEKLYIDQRNLGEYFFFAPFVADVSGVMKGCDLIAMPSLWEACPLQPMEALCAGVPFVGSDCIGLREVIEGTPAVQVKAGHATSLAEGILKCLEIGRKPFEDYAPIAVERFDVRKTAKEIHKLYERVL